MRASSEDTVSVLVPCARSTMSSSEETTKSPPPPPAQDADQDESAATAAADDDVGDPTTTATTSTTAPPKTRKVTIVIPEDSTAEEGDVLSFDVDGQELQMQVPPGAQPGDALEIFIGEDAADVIGEGGGGVGADGAIEIEEVTAIALSDGRGGTVALVLDASPDDEEEEEEEDDDDDEDDGTQSVAWPSGIMFATYLTNVSPKSVRGKRVLELGSGLGTCGLAAAVAGAKSVTLTDRPSAVPALARCVGRNRSKIVVAGDGDDETKNGATCEEVRVAPLTWGAESVDGDDDGKYDVVIGSDLLYDPEPANLEALGDSLAAAVDAGGTVLLAVRWRKPDAERRFFEIMKEKHGFEFALVDVPSTGGEKDLFLPCKLSWRDYGDPSCEASNSYFASSQVKVAGALAAVGETIKEEQEGGDEEESGDRPAPSVAKTVPLGEITEEHQELLSDEEFVVFEAMQTQIYRGKRVVWNLIQKSMKKRELKHHI